MIRANLMSLSVAVALALGGCTYTDWRDSLTEADYAQMNAAVQAALETRKSGESGNWADPTSGRRGTVTPTKTWSDDGQTCRDYQQTLTIDDVTRVGYGSACRAANGVWVTRQSPRFVVAGTPRYRYRPHRLFYGFGHGYHFGHGHYGYWHHHAFGPYPLHAYRYGYPYYWY